MEKWKCKICKKEYNIRQNVGLCNSLNPKEDICIKCYNKGVDKNGNKTGY